MHTPYRSTSQQKPSKASLLLKRASEKNAAILKEKTVEEHREMQQKLAAVRIVPPHYEYQELDIAGVPCECIIPPRARQQKVVIYLHGGSWAFGNRKTAKAMGALLAEATGQQILVVQYRLAPEYPYPHGLHDCYAVYCWLLDTGILPENIALVGDSAGGNLALCLTHLLAREDKPAPACLCLASPVTDLRESCALLQSGVDLIYTVHQGRTVTIFDLYLNGHRPDDPLISPVMGDLGRLPPTLIHTGGDEPLALDNEVFAKLAWDAGSKIHLKLWDEMFHDFTVVGITLKESRHSIAEMGDFIRLHINC